ncbi:tRNA epoxyqueuosine(34) reductase QueG [Lewinella cohaerens]|uniref:tRNA epoxyqueuosine(34) reductase QueG n=1 Tax=Lewinella cohaerens TaxID=70995 RepID=UPI00037CE1D4|nr:tRNA epoxyqueuosine(34) reductase QueG [Lewinella cohaerens]
MLKGYGDNSAAKKLILEEAHRLGFSFVGVAKADFLEPEARRLEAWLNEGRHGKMGYLENHFDKRVDPRKLVPGAKSVISLLYNYHNPALQKDPAAPKISQYAYGEDYHFVVKDKLKSLFTYIRENIGEIDGRVFVDSAPVMERDWALKAGNGWVGKHTLLIHPKAGSYFFLAELISDLDLPADAPMKDYCGTCRRCIDACPTDAIAPEGYLMDGSKCISYVTIELKEAIPEDFRGKMDNWMFGCDICQQVCPWNRFATSHEEPSFNPPPDLMEMRQEDWQELTEETFRKVFRRSAVKRTKYTGLQRNISFLRNADE